MFFAKGKAGIEPEIRASECGKLFSCHAVEIRAVSPRKKPLYNFCKRVRLFLGKRRDFLFEKIEHEGEETFKVRRLAQKRTPRDHRPVAHSRRILFEIDVFKGRIEHTPAFLCGGRGGKNKFLRF